MIELAMLPQAIRSMGDVDLPQAEAAARLSDGRRRSVRLDALTPDEIARLREEAVGPGVVVLPGIHGASGKSPVIVVADDPSLRRLGTNLETRGLRAVGSALRTALTAYDRTAFGLAFADGTLLDLADGTRVMGVLNVTPDSFAGGGAVLTPQQAADAAARMLDEGADLVDVGGESTRPGADPVLEDEEVRRVVPAIEAIKRRCPVRISVDTTKVAVARLAIEAGADLVNDVSGFADAEMLAVIRAMRVPAIAMHRRGTPKTMQQDTQYVDLLSSVVGFLRNRVEKAVAAGVADDKILIDPGLGFGKSAAGNLQILRELPTLKSVGRPIVVGASRKAFIGGTLDLPVGERLEGSLAVAAFAAWSGAHVVRAHDVAATKRVTRMIDTIRTT
ncbi:MAG TPA: dihydropteroate synthase [Candidatus Polarisedimenticolaceae bacterium]|nr:dihydropteroate synthase [Candidatus Polarisedimenticolaceae bacterium]